MAAQDHALLVAERGNGKSEPAEARRDLGELSVRMSAWVVGPGGEIGKRPFLNFTDAPINGQLVLASHRYSPEIS